MNPAEINKRISDLDAALQDPFFERKKLLALEFKEMIDDSPDITDQDADQIVSGLDDEVAEFIKTKAQGCGYLYQEDETGLITSRFYDGEIIFNGYIFYENPDTGTKTLMYSILIPSDDSLTSINPQLPIKGTIAHIDHFNIELETMSLERAVAYLNTFTPHLLEEIDTNILGTDGTEIDVVMSLGNIDFNEIINREDYETVQKCLDVYIESLVRLDYEVPYTCLLDGTVIVNRYDSIHFTQLEHDFRLVALLRVCVRSMTTSTNDLDSETTAHVFLEGYLIMPDRQQESQHCLIPLSSITNMMSTRDLIADVERSIS